MSSSSTIDRPWLQLWLARLPVQPDRWDLEVFAKWALTLWPEDLSIAESMPTSHRPGMLDPVLGCLTCGRVPPYCDECVASSEMHLKGIAMARGVFWAERVATRMPTKRAPARWPGYDESKKVRTMALRKVENLTPDPRLRERLARLCVSEAIRAWSKRR